LAHNPHRKKGSSQFSVDPSWNKILLQGGLDLCRIPGFCLQVLRPESTRTVARVNLDLGLQRVDVFAVHQEGVSWFYL